jgi:hypothetical protein
VQGLCADQRRQGLMRHPRIIAPRHRRAQFAATISLLREIHGKSAR